MLLENLLGWEVVIKDGITALPAPPGTRLQLVSMVSDVMFNAIILRLPPLPKGKLRWEKSPGATIAVHMKDVQLGTTMGPLKPAILPFRHFGSVPLKDKDSYALVTINGKGTRMTFPSMLQTFGVKPGYYVTPVISESDYRVTGFQFTLIDPLTPVSGRLLDGFKVTNETCIKETLELFFKLSLLETARISKPDPFKIQLSDEMFSNSLVAKSLVITATPFSDQALTINREFSRKRIEVAPGTPNSRNSLMERLSEMGLDPIED